MKKLKYGGFSLLVTVIFIAGIVLLNVLSSLLTTRFFLKADLTEAGLFTLSPEAAEALENLRDEIEIVVLMPQEDALLNGILQQYAAASGGLIRYRYIDPELNPSLKDDYPTLTAINIGDVIVSSDRRVKSFNVNDIIIQTYGETGSMVQGFNADQQFVSAIQYVLNERVPVAAFIGGHEETESATLRALLEQFGYECADVVLELDDIPQDTTLLISNAPRRDFTDAEIEKLDVYMGTGGNAVIAYDYETQTLPRLDAYLLEWGVAMESRLIIDNTNSYVGMPFFLRAELAAPEGAPPIMANLVDTGAYFASMPFSRPIHMEWPTGSKGRRTAASILNSAGTSFAKDNTVQIENYEKEDGDTDGPFTIGAAVRQSQYDADNNPFDSYMLVVNAGLMNESLLSSPQVYYNSMIMAALVDTLNPFSGESIYIPAKATDTGYLDVTPAQATVVLVLLVIIIPLLIIAAGILTWRRRKNL